ncbi:HXXEE domain-containing protein [Aeribacillus pallidus]|uniref:HXXEE domain-containing protein n=1 Tax=Aeribacillus pallidus TaxID=33936 RepID=UPI003D223F84
MNIPISKLNRLIWLFPLLYFIHDVEEILTVEEFLTKHSDVVPIKVTTLEFTLAFLLLWILTFIGCYKASKNKRFLGLEPKTFFSFLVPGIFLANGIGHLIQLILFQSYVPGIITSIVIIYPYSFITLKYLIHEQLLTVRKFHLFLCLGFILQAPIALLAHIIVKGMVYYVPLLFNELVDKGGF